MGAELTRAHAASGALTRSRAIAYTRPAIFHRPASARFMSLSPRQSTRSLTASLVSTLSITLAVGLTTLLPGCGWWSSGKQRTDTSAGQQLSDLRKAYDSGSITREEYERERRRIIGDW